MRPRTLAPILVALLAVSLAACEREERRFRELPAVSGSSPGSLLGIRMSEIQPGQSTPPPKADNPYEENAYAVSEEQRLYTWYNCAGCHAQGGGDIGPPLMDDKWIYGSEPANIFATIVEGRPNGMPSFRDRIRDHEVWQLVAYVRSLSGLVRKDAVASRRDAIQAKEPATLQEPEEPKTSGLPPASEQSR